MDTKLECEVDAEGTVDMMFRGEELPYGIAKDPMIATKKSRGNSRVLPDCRSKVPIQYRAVPKATKGVLYFVIINQCDTQPCQNASGFLVYCHLFHWLFSDIVNLESGNHAQVGRNRKVCQRKTQKTLEKDF